MAKVFLGDRSRVDNEVLEAVQTLPDDFWVLGEFTLRRNYDWLIVRPFDQAPATVIVTEVKRRGRPLRGTLNAPWEERTDDATWEPILPPNNDDRNFYFQAVNAANSLNEWLQNNERVFNEGEEGVWSGARVWPDLLLLSPPSVTHLLPNRPDNGYGAWFYTLDRWIQHLVTWHPKVGPYLLPTHVERLVRHLGLEPVHGDVATITPALPQPTTPPAPLVPPAPEAADRPGASVAPLSQMVEDLADRVARLERALAQVARALAPLAERAAVSVVPPRELTPVERSAITQAVRQVIQKGYVRVLPSVVTQLEEILGENLKTGQYHGFGSASNLMQQAEREGVVCLGSKIGPSPTVWLPGETPA